ncbi:MAG: hypothetical protein ABJB09_04590 [Verrucomicrobiota bacterium]
MGYKWLSAGLTFVNASTIAGLLLGIAFHGLSFPGAVFSIWMGLGTATLAYLATYHPPAPANASRSARNYSSIWLWLVVAGFALFALRSFCWLLFIQGNELKIQSPNNLGDLALHLTYINNFASGVALWPDNPIYVFSKMRYPAGIDLFNALFVTLGFNLTRNLIWTGLAASAATCYAFYKWGGAFGIAGFLFNGGLAGYYFVQKSHFLGYQGDKTIAWKSIPLTMFVTQRGLLYAIPAGLLLLCHWRSIYFAKKDAHFSKGILPFWLELSLYASMPLFHVHTFLALSVVLLFFFLLGDRDARKRLALLVGSALLPATFFVWLVTDNLHAGSVLKWQPGWVQHNGDFALPFFSFWLLNFGVWGPLVALLFAVSAWITWKHFRQPEFRLQQSVAFLLPAAAIFLLAWLVKTAPWEWDNIKLLIWAYFIVLPFLWSELIVRWPYPVRLTVCVILFSSGILTLGGALGTRTPTYTMADRAELDSVGMVVKKLPIEARFAAFPTYNHPLLLQGRKMVMGYPGHLWTQGFDYSKTSGTLTTLMQGASGWREAGRALHARYLFWGREEKLNYAQSKHPWEKEAKLIVTGAWGAIYDLESPP